VAVPDWQLVEGYLLAFLRTGTAIALMPVLGYQAVPVQVKVGFAAVLALAIAPEAAMQVAAGPPGPLPMAAAALQEVAVGLMIGAATLLILAAAEMAGSLLGIQIGFGVLSTIDPLTNIETNVFGRLNYLLALAIFIALDAHHFLITALAESLRLIPLGSFAWTPQMPIYFARLAADAVDVAIRLAAPVLVVILLMEVGLAFVARAMPQMNVFIISIPLKIGVGLLAFVAGLPLFIYVLSKSIGHFERGILKLIGMAGGR